jgi:murein DD-endopeptidase MepM/ murein hydrolase activator NlpD
VGTWRVHRTHYGAKNDQAYALDLVFIDERSRRRARTNQEFSCYNVPVVADAPGVVVIAVDGIPENEPGVPNRYDMHGNYVVIDHQNGEYSLMAHLIPGTLTVRAGQRVNAGSELGRCGNSGHSTMPHLHWQVMSHPNASVARGVVPRLLPYDRNGAPSTEMPQPGDLLTPR